MGREGDRDTTFNRFFFFLQQVSVGAQCVCVCVTVLSIIFFLCPQGDRQQTTCPGIRNGRVFAALSFSPALLGSNTLLLFGNNSAWWAEKYIPLRLVSPISPPCLDTASLRHTVWVPGVSSWHYPKTMYWCVRIAFAINITWRKYFNIFLQLVRINTATQGERPWKIKMVRCCNSALIFPVLGCHSDSLVTAPSGWANQMQGVKQAP